MKSLKKSAEFVRLLEIEIERNLECPIVVEGDRDVAVLRELGFCGKIIKINTGKSLEETSREISSEYKEVILFFDFDRRGTTLMNRVRIILSAYGTKCHIELWKKAKSLPIGSVEDLPSYLRSIEKEAP